VPKIGLKILGSGREVGRSAILVYSYEDGTQILLDYGVSVSEEEPGFPLHVQPRKLSAILLSHAHLDHSGALPLLYISESKPLYTTLLNLEISRILIMDFLKISGYYIPFEVIELESMTRSFVPLNYNDKVEVDGVTITAYDAGHIPGSVAYLLNINGVNILYTGDFNTRDTCLLKGARLPVEKADIILTEATYSLYSHPSREEVEKKFVASLEEVLDEGGRILIPAFSVGRSQEILCILEKYGLTRYPVYMDGMARTVTQIYLENRRFLANPKLFEKAIEGVITVSGTRKRKEAIKKKQSIIVAPAGMLKGGPAMYYVRRIAEKRNNGVFFVSYQAPGSNGRSILLEGIIPVLREKGIPVKARVEWFDFSSHVSKREIIDFLSRAKKDAKIVVVHSPPKGGEYITNLIREKLGRESIFPANGEEFIFEF